MAKPSPCRILFCGTLLSGVLSACRGESGSTDAGASGGPASSSSGAAMSSSAASTGSSSSAAQSAGTSSSAPATSSSGAVGASSALSSSASQSTSASSSASTSSGGTAACAETVIKSCYVPGNSVLFCNAATTEERAAEVVAHCTGDRQLADGPCPSENLTGVCIYTNQPSIYYYNGVDLHGPCIGTHGTWCDL